jgi:CheY-like chemotaxis protein
MTPRILVIDDNEPALAVRIEALRLRMADVVVDAAADANDALSKASAYEYAVIVCNSFLRGVASSSLTSALQQLCPDAVLVRIALTDPPETTSACQCDIAPLETDELQNLLDVALEHPRWATEDFGRGPYGVA